MLLSLMIGFACTKASTDVIQDTQAQRTALPELTQKDPPPPPPRPLDEVVSVPEDLQGLVSALEEAETAEAAASKLTAMGPAAVPTLRDIALHGEDIGARGWAITALQQIPGAEADTALDGIYQYGAAPELVRTWAGAAIINRCADLDCVMGKASMAQQYPALKRPIRLQVEARSDSLQDIGAALVAMSQNPDLTEPLAPVVLAGGPAPLLDVMFHHADNNARRMAAGFLGTLGQDDALHMEIAKAYAYTPGADKVLWQGGALYVPSLQWQKKEAQVLVGHLVAWHLYCDRMGLVQEKQQIYNNLQSINLHRPAGMDWPNQDTNALLVQYGNAAGKQALERILAEQGVKDEDKYQSLLGQVKGLR